MASKPTILLLSLAGDQQIFHDIYGRLLRKLDDRADVQAARTAQQGLELLSNSATNKPQGIFVTDSALTLKKHHTVAEKVVDYARNGGRVVIGGLFSSYTRPSDMTAFFTGRWNLSWASGTYQRTTVSLNSAAASASGVRPGAGLPASYSQKAVFLKNVDDSAAWYLPAEGSVLESHVFAPSPVQNRAETPVAFVRVGAGWLGYVGDVNAEEESDVVVLGMLGLL